MVNRRPSKEEGGGYSWMDTYGDMVTLLLTFFVLLFAFSSVDDDKWSGLVQAFTGSPPLRNITAVDMLTLPDFSQDLPNTYLNLDGMVVGSGEPEETDDPSPQALTPEQLAQLAVPVSAQQRLVMESEAGALYPNERAGGYALCQPRYGEHLFASGRGRAV
jgi:flagellar motor protein MotB